MADIYQLVYFSELAPLTRAKEVARIVKTARSNNAKLNITGILIFDGQHFGQLLEGDKIHVATLMNTIMTDPRHHELHIAHQAVSPDGRHFKDCFMAYGLAQNEAVLKDLATLGNMDCLRQLLAIVPDLDMA